MEYLIRDRLSWLRFLGFDLGATTPDANTIRLFREKLTEVGALDTLFADFDRQLKERGYLAMGGQIVDATLVAAPKQRNIQAEKDAIKEGKTAAAIWPDEPARAAQKDTDARWTLKCAKAKPTADGKPGGRHRDSELRLQEQHLDLPSLRLHPQVQGHRRGPI